MAFWVDIDKRTDEQLVKDLVDNLRIVRDVLIPDGFSPNTVRLELNNSLELAAEIERRL